MVKNMSLKTAINKKGSYILEASISLPIFMIALVVVCSIFLMYQGIEEANFILGCELRRGAAEAIYLDSGAIIPPRLQADIRSANSHIDDLTIKDYGYRVSRFGQDELIAIKYGMRMRTNSPLNIASEASYELGLVTRAYVGKERDLDNMSIEEMMADGSAVYIFPKRGEKYHSKGCSFLSAASRSTILTSELKTKYDTCPVCHSKKAAIGSLVYYFPQDGEAFHIPGCATLERNYIEIEKRVAVKRGYTACSKCGG